MERDGIQEQGLSSLKNEAHSPGCKWDEGGARTDTLTKQNSFSVINSFLAAAHQFLGDHALKASCGREQQPPACF